MTNIPALAVGVGLLAAALTATPAVAADPAPTGVTIAWKDSTHEFVRVTWTEDGDHPNKVVVKRPGNPTTFLPVYVPAGAANVVDYPAAKLGPIDGTLEIGVSAGTAAAETSAVSVSPPFDTIIAGFASRVSNTMTGSSGLHVKWRLYTLSEQDVTPNDPLDLTDSVRYTPQLVVDDKVTPLAAASKATEFSFTGPPPPYRFAVLTSNEWGSWSNQLVLAERSGLKAVIPTWVKAGSAAGQPVITGSFAGYSAPIYLQARNTATSPWYTVASRIASSGTFRFELGAAGSRQYRVLVANHQESESRAYFGSYSPTVAMTVQINPYNVSWIPNVVRRGQTAMAGMFHSPAPSGTVILQRWTGKTWSVVGPVHTASGYARGYVKGAAPGRVAYRYYLPAVTVNGMWYAAAYSPNFVLTTV